MYKDQFDRDIFEAEDILTIIYEHNIELLEKIVVKDSSEIQKFNLLNNNLLNTESMLVSYSSVEDFDKDNQSNWYMPDEYKNMDIEGYLVHVCPKEHYQRLMDEIVEYRKRNMLPLLRWLKYFVDTLRKNSVVWGVGRGSSVSSYVLYLIGVHKIDSIKYKLDYKDFLR